MIIYIYNIKLATGRWSSPRTPVFHINKSDLDDIAEILLKAPSQNPIISNEEDIDLTVL